MTEQERVSIKHVLEAALHNAKLVKDQLDSLYNPKDKSFPDWDMRDVMQQVQEAVDAVERSLEELDATQAK